MTASHEVPEDIKTTAMLLGAAGVQLIRSRGYWFLRGNGIVSVRLDYRTHEILPNAEVKRRQSLYGSCNNSYIYEELR